LTLKSVGIVFLLLEAAMDWMICLCLRYSASIFFLEMTGGVSTILFPSW
jgi:hypothetical protein